MAVALFDGQVLPLDYALEPVAQGVPMQQVAHADGLLHVLVGIDGGDAAAGGAELLVAEPVLLKAVEQLVVGHADGGAVADLEMVGAYLDARLAQLHRLTEEMLKVDDDAGAENVDGLIAQDAGGHEVHDELALFIDDGVAGVVAALIADDDVIVLAEQVDHTALALIAPVSTNNRSQHSAFSSFFFIHLFRP